MPLEDFFKPKSKRGFMYNLADNLIGYDDGRVTPGERFGKMINGVARNPVETVLNMGKSVNDELNYLMFQGGAEREPEKVLGYAAAPMAPGALRGRVANVVSAGGAKPKKGITAYHGSPHDFDRFSMDKIGTGEGAQAYGHGLYFAEAEDVARSYRDALTGNHTGGNVVLKVGGREVAEPTSAQRAIARYGADEASNIFKRNLERAQKKLDGLPQYASDGIDDSDLERLVAEADVDAARKAIADVDSLRGTEIGYAPPGRMYEVRINADPDDFLDWDAPLRDQPKIAERLGVDPSWRLKKADEIIENLKADMAAGGRTEMDAIDRRNYELAEQLQTEFSFESASGYAPRSDEMARELREKGIPGVKYRDYGSRGADGAESGTRNFVVFDENLIEIVRKYGIAGAAAMLGMSQADLEQQMEGL